MNKTDLHSSLLFLMLKLEEAKSNPDDRQELHCCIDGSSKMFP